MNKSEILKDKKFLLPLVIVVLLTILVPVGIFKTFSIIQGNGSDEVRPELEAINIEFLFDDGIIKDVKKIYRDVSWIGSGVVYKQYVLNKDIDDKILLMGYKGKEKNKDLTVRESFIDVNLMKKNMKQTEKGLKGDIYKTIDSNFFKEDSVFVIKEVFSTKNDGKKNVPEAYYYIAYNKKSNTLDILYVNF